LRAAENNLNRLDDIIGQIEGQLLSLRRQSRQATRYKRLAGEINEYKALLWLKRWISAIDTLAAATEAATECDNRVADTATKASELTRKAAELSGLLEPKREEQIIAAAVLGRLNAAKDALESDEEAASSEIKKLEAQISDLAADLERETGIVTDANEAEAILKMEFDQLSAVADTSAALDAAADAASEAIKIRSSLEADYNELTRKAADQNARRESAQRELSQAEARLNRVITERESTQDRLAGMSQDGGSSGNLFAAGAKEALNALEAARVNEQTLAKNLTSAEQVDQEARDVLAKSRQALSSLTGERTALERMLARSQSASYEPALNQCKAKPGFEKALAAVLGEDLDASIGGKEAMRWGGAPVSDQALPSGSEPLSNFVSAPAELAARLSQIGVVGSASIDIISDQLKPGQRLVTKDGQVSRWDGFEIAAGAETSAAVKLQQQNRLAEIINEIETAETTVSSHQNAFDSARANRNEAQEAVRVAKRALPDLERTERAAQSALSQYETDIARANAEKRSLEDRLERLNSEIKELTTQRDTAKENFEGLDAFEDVSEQKATLEDKLRDARNIADEASADYRSLKNETEARAARLKSVEKERADWSRRSETATKRVAQLETRSTAAKTTLSAATDGPDKFADRRTRLFEELEAAEARRSAASDSLSSAETELRNAENAARDAEQTHSAAREARAGAEARKTAAQERITETKARINETLNCEPSELKSHLGDLSPESGLSESDIEKKLDRLSVEREKMGGVNLRADEEAVEQEERLTAMNDERADLIAAIARLREGIDELNQEGRERLLKAFDIVNGHFGRLFTTLFGGGEASLALTESDDPLEAGLEVMARPPGKSLKAMSLLSGGEQALTATALIFAVFLSNPAPVCVLDEVDAPLDDANVARYCDLLDDMKKHTNTKFIAITHNPVTMSRMDRLFGVTMAEQGVSQLLSIELNAAEKLVAAE